jgi:hypothetical protein
MSSKAVNDVRATSFDAASHRPEGYQGTIDDVLAQMRAEPEVARPYWPLNMSRERYELLGFLGVRKAGFSGLEMYRAHFARLPIRFKPEDDTVEYGAPEAPADESPYSLAYAMRQWPRSFKS